MPNIQIEDIPNRPESDQAAFFEACRGRAIEAQAVLGVSAFRLRVAGGVMEIRFAGQSLTELLLPAIAHLLIEDDVEPELVLHAFDTASTGVAIADMPVAQDCLTDRGDLWSFNSERYRSAFHWIESTVNVMDTDTGEAVFWVNRPSDLPYWTIGSPFRTIFHWWMETRGAQLIHAACVGYNDRAVLITGKGGVGKSTSAIACLERGMLYAADDYLIVTQDDIPRAHSLYNTAKLEADKTDRFPNLAALIRQPPKPGDKAVISLFPERAGQLASGLPISAIVTPAFGGGDETVFEPIAAAELRSAAAFTTLSQLPHAGNRTIDFVTRLVAARPGFRMRLGPIEQVPDAIERLLERTEDELWAMSKEGGAAGETSDLPLISVVVPVYNGAHFLKDAIESILLQNYPNLEIIVVDDGSTDDIDAAVSALPVDVRFFRQPNQGPSAARNRGVRDASGSLVAFLDVDDLWPAERLDLLTGELQDHPELDVVRGYAQLSKRANEDAPFEPIGNPEESFPNYIGAALYRKSAFERVGLFDEFLTFAEDTDWFVRADAAKLKVKRVPHVTLQVRRHETNMTKGQSQAALNPLRLFRKQLELRRQEQSAG